MKKITIHILMLSTLYLFTGGYPIQAKTPPQYSSPMVQQAVEQLNRANLSQKQSKQLILNANKTRKQLKSIRAKQVQNSLKGHQQQKPESASSIEGLLSQLKQQQQQGAYLREQSQQLKHQASLVFEQALVEIWPEWINNRDALTMDNTVQSYFAHNAQLRSVHKNMLANRATPMEKMLDKRDDMSLVVPALAKQNAPANLNIGAFQFSREERYFAHIEVHNTINGKKNGKKRLNQEDSLSANVASVPLNKIHQWRLVISDLAGKPLENAEIEVQGHMPGHVHGLPTAPAITREIESGVYLVDGVKFQMKGWWVMKFILRSPGDNKAQSSSDFFTFNVVL